MQTALALFVSAALAAEEPPRSDRPGPEKIGAMLTATLGIASIALGAGMGWKRETTQREHEFFKAMGLKGPQNASFERRLTVETNLLITGVVVAVLALAATVILWRFSDD